MDACDEAVEENPPVRQHGEVAEFLADAVRGRMDPVIDPVCQLRGEAVCEEQEAEEGKSEWWEEP